MQLHLVAAAATMASAVPAAAPTTVTVAFPKVDTYSRVPRIINVAGIGSLTVTIAITVAVRLRVIRRYRHTRTAAEQKTKKHWF